MKIRPLALETRYDVLLPETSWDDTGLAIYKRTVREISSLNSRELTIGNRKNNTVVVTNQETKFWNGAMRGKWEPKIFDNFDTYISSKTTVVDFGTWIGPTLLYHGQFSKTSIGIEADPAAFAKAEENLNLNKRRNPEWAKHVFVYPACVSSDVDSGKKSMRSAKHAGRSSSGIGDKIYLHKEKVSKFMIWNVQCYTLQHLFAILNIQKPYKHVLIKIDVESYECKLIPSFYDWLKHETFLPTFFISFHPQISPCTDKEFRDVLKVLKLYDTVSTDTGTKIDMKDVNIDNFKLISKKSDVLIFSRKTKVE